MKTRRGFTLLEMIVVIVVIGILTGVMIPVIASIVHKSQKENDKVLVDNMNGILRADENYDDKPSTGDEVLWILSGNGFEVDDPNFKDYSFYWVREYNRVVIYDNDKQQILYPSEHLQNVTVDLMTPEYGRYLLSGKGSYSELAYKITYYLNGKEIRFKDKTSYDGTEEIILPVPNMDKLGADYEFNGWYTTKNLTGDKVDRIAIGTTGDLIFYAEFHKKAPTELPVNTYKIDYELNGGVLYNPVTLYEGPLAADIILPIPTKENCTFKGWYTDSEFTSEEIKTIPAGSTGDKKYYAKWEQDLVIDPDDPIIPVDPVIPIYKIEYDLQGGTNPDNAPSEYDGRTKVVLPIPDKENHRFLYWTNTDGAIITEINIGTTGDQLFTAHWQYRTPGEFYITYVLNGGLLYDPPTVMKGEEDIYLFTPLRRGYNFVGWYLDSAFVGEPISVITKDMQIQDITVYAKWEAIQYEINYELNGGYWENSNIVNYVYTMDTVTEYTQPIRDGYGFLGWYDNPDFEGYPVSSSTIGETGIKHLYAKWEEGVYKIIYLADGIDNPEEMVPTKYTTNDIVHLPIPKKKGYEFIGWHKESDFSDAVVTEIPQNSVGTQIFYAEFEIIKYNINYIVSKDDEVISFENKINTYTVEEDLDFKDIQPSTKYYEFKGWYTIPECTGDIFTTINKGTIGDITLYAKWEGIELILPAEFNGGTLSNRTINHFAEELVADMNAAGQAITGQETTIENFKKNSYRNINYLWGNGNTEMIEKYQWFFEFAKTELLAAANSSNYYTQKDVKYIYNSVVKMFEQLLAKNPHALDPYNYHGNGLCNDCGVTHNGEVYAALGDTEGHNKTLFRAWIDGLINSTFYFSADIYRAAMLDFSEAENMRKFNVAYTGKELEVVTKDVLPIPVQEGYRFLGWYDNPEFTGDTYETTAEIYDLFSYWDDNNQSEKKNSFTLYAKWQAIPKYEITFTMNGGHWEDMSLDKFANELVYFFKIVHQQYESYPDTTRENFFNESRPNIHIVWYDATLWNKYHWFFEFAKSEITTYANKAGQSITNTKAMLETITSNKESAINVFKLGDVAYTKHSYYTPLDILCEWIHCVINQCGPINRSWLPDYSKPENMARFYKAYNATKVTFNMYENDTLPTPIREGYTFLGWYNNPEFTGSPVSIVNASGNLYAKWQLTQNVNNDEQLANALNNAYNGDTIVLNAGNYTEDHTIEAPNLTIIGPNVNVNPNELSRGSEATFTGTLTIAPTATNLTIDGLSFTGNAKIVGAQVTGLTFQNNYVHDTTSPSNKWAEGNTYDSGFIYISSGDNSNLSSNLNFKNNKFTNVKDVNILVSYVDTVLIKGNKFSNFSYDGVRFNNGYIVGTIDIFNNEFIQDTLGGYNGIFFRIYGAKEEKQVTINIKGNRFVKIGQNYKYVNPNDSSDIVDPGLYSGAISARNYNEYGAEWIISNNSFEKCYNYIRLRNNGTAANHSAYDWLATIENNQFIGEPTTYYFASRNKADTTITNPVVTIFGANYYIDNNSNVINDLTLYDSKFLDVKTKGTTLDTAPIISAE